MSSANQNQTGGRHAIVIGGSIGGLLAAQVLADFYERVTIIDRDRFPEAPEHRKGVPQSHHAHALLARGQQIIEQLFPGILHDLRADGAHTATNVVPVALISPAGRLPVGPVPEYMAFSRVLLEWHVRQRVRRRPGVAVISECDVTGLLAAPDRTRVRGVQLRPRGDSAPAELEADLVVDASGRGSRAPEWLAELGYEAPSEELITSGLGYASRFYARPADFPAEWQGLIVNGRAPDNPRAGLILPIEHGRWHVTVGGFAGHHPPNDEQGFLEWARGLPDPSLYEAIRVAEPLSPIRGYRTPENRLRHFDRLERWPAGLIVTGDAVAAFNPIYGQGMTARALDALALEAVLREQRDRPQPGFEQRFQRRLMAHLDPLWTIATAEDLRWPGVTITGARPRRSQGLIHRYMDLVLRQAVEDPLVTQAYTGVISLLVPPARLGQPDVLLRTLGGALRRALRPRGAQPPQPRYALSPDALADLRARPTAR
jgi:2-polyprenyl-6-methoxyphenol hydroxylase-like FAD-dependent oxidoreductase